MVSVELAARQAQNSGVGEHVHDAQATWCTEDVDFTHRRLSTVCSNPTVNPVILNVFFPALISCDCIDG